MEIRKAIFMLLCLLLAGYLCFEGAEGFNNPNYGKYKTIIKKQKQVEESDIEPARAVNPRRKASENKRPWLTDTFLEMENLVFEPWDNVYRTMDWPKYAWPDGTRQNYRPDQYPDWSGCVISAPPYWNLQTQGNTYLVHINIIKGVIRAVQVKGPAKLGKIDNLEFPVHVYPNAANGTIVKVTLFTVSIVEQGRYYGTCNAETKIENGECVCPSSAPTVYASGSTIDPGGTQTLWVDSGGLSCPPYTWTVSGLGYTLSKGTTDNDLETVTLTSAGGACGVGYGAYAVVTAEDNCGNVSSISILNTGGAYGSGVFMSTRCLAGGDPCSNDCSNMACGGGGANCESGTDPAGDTLYYSIYKFVFQLNGCSCMGTASYCRLVAGSYVPATGTYLHPTYQTPELGVGKLDCPHAAHRCINMGYWHYTYGCP